MTQGSREATSDKIDLAREPKERMKSELISYAQNREDVILSGFFKSDEKGFYVDVGANDPADDSVTKYFYDRGWRGINIEPLRHYYEDLVKERPRDVNLNIGIGEEEGKLTLREYVAGAGLSTFSNALKTTYKKDDDSVTKEYIDHEVRVRPLKEVLTEHKAQNISFMKIDVEGFEYEVLTSNDWRQFRPEVICIEATHIKKDWRAILREHEYVLVFFDGLNEYYVDKKKPERAKNFSYVEAVIFREPIVSYRLLPKLHEYEHLRKQISELKGELELKSKYIAHLEGAIMDITPLRRHIKRQAKLRLKSIDERIITRLNSGRIYSPKSIIPGNELLVAARQTDEANFREYNQKSRRALTLSLYLLGRKAGVSIVSRVLRLRRV